MPLFVRDGRIYKFNLNPKFPGLEVIQVFKVEVGVEVKEGEYHLRKVGSVQIDISYPNQTQSVIF